MRKIVSMVLLVGLAVAGCNSSNSSASAQGPDASHGGGSTSTGNTSTGQTTAGGGSGSSGVNPHWVLYDKDGNPVKAIVRLPVGAAMSEGGTTL